MDKAFFILLIVFSVFFGCQSSDAIEEKIATSSVNLSYAKKFRIKKMNDATILELLGDKSNARVTATFVLYKNQKPAYVKDAYYIKIPVKKVASMSSIYTTMLFKLKSEQSVVAIDNADYYTNPFILNKVQSHEIVELSKASGINLEKTLILNPDLLFTFGMGNPKSDVDEKLMITGIPVAISIDHLEETPLARAEWIKFFACFFDKEKLADSLFRQTEKRYIQLKSLTHQVINKPKVLTEIKYGDAWYIPSSKSYVAHLINDAGGDYFWKDDAKSGSTPLSFEIVYTKAKDCDVWLNLYNINSKKDLKSFDERYELFKAYQKNQLYNNNKIQNAFGYSNYWETGMINPDDILADLIAIFWPDKLPNHQFTYYKKIE